MSEVLVVGYGSIGERHARILSDSLGLKVTIVTGRSVSDFPRCATLDIAMSQSNPNYIVISNSTSLHSATLKKLIDSGYKGVTLVEKPLCASGTEFCWPSNVENIYVGYNLRFHPLIQKLKKILEHKTIVTFNAYVGQYLPFWRPVSDYRKSYSSSAELGGGVLRDLSHELDLALWMLGDWDRLVAYGGHFSSLEINSEDACTIIAQSKRCASLVVHMNYIDKQVRRKILVNTLNETIEVDLVDSFISINGVKEYCIVDRDQTYKDMHSSILGSNNNHACCFNDGLKVVDMIDSVERSINKRVWIDNLFTVRRPK